MSQIASLFDTEAEANRPSVTTGAFPAAIRTVLYYRCEEFGYEEIRRDGLAF
jgi:hypothetical protein